MLIQRMDPARFQEVYNIGCHSLYPTAGLEGFVPFGSTYCQVEPGGHSAKHHHHENETFLILSGRGRMQIGAETAELAAGDVVLIPALSHHRLDNTGPEPLRFVSIYWCAPLVPQLPREVLVIPAPPTPNGPLHVGHLSGPYLATDVFTRYAKLRGAKALFAMGTDDNQCYVAAKGRQLGLTGEQVAAKFVPLIMGALDDFGCTVHQRLHPLGIESYTRYVQDTFAQLIASGAVEKRRGPAPFCLETRQFVYGAQVSGGCPGCKQPTNGNGCEACGAYNDGHDLIQPKSNIGSKGVELREAEKYYFPLSRHGDALRAMIAEMHMHPALRAYYNAYLDRGLPDVAVSQFGTWGVPAPGLPGQVLYEWYEMAPGYLYLAREASQRHGCGDFFSGPDGAVVECFGFDNAFFYGFLVPALIRAIDPRARPPRAFLFNFFYQLDGKKFSTSRGHAVWADEILAAAPPDALRFYLAKSRSEDRETNFGLADLVAFTRGTLVGEWEALVRAVDGALARRDRRVPAHEGSLSWDHERLLNRLDRLVGEVHESYGLERFALNHAARLLNDMLALIASAYYRAQDEANNLAVTCHALRVWASLLKPIMPGFGGALAASLNGPTAALAIDPRAAAFTAGPLPVDALSAQLAGLTEFARARV